MDDDAPVPRTDLTLSGLSKEDLYDGSVDDLKERIEALRAEITRCERALAERGGARNAADALFKSD